MKETLPKNYLAGFLFRYHLQDSIFKGCL